MTIRSHLTPIPKHLIFWIMADLSYVYLLSFFLGNEIPLSFSRFTLIHLVAIAVGTMVMFTGLGAGILWIPILTFFNIRPSEAVAISIFTQIAGKGTGSITYLFNGMVDMKIALTFIPMALAGVTIGFLTGFQISAGYERFLLYFFLIIAAYLLVRTIFSLYTDAPEPDIPSSRQTPLPDPGKSWPVVVLSSFFTGLLSIGNTDWLIPHMTLKLKMPTDRAVATGLFIMFITTLFYLFLAWMSVWITGASWPEGTPLLYATCSGVIVGAQIGTRLTRISWFARHQKHMFIIFLSISMIQLLW